MAIGGAQDSIAAIDPGLSQTSTSHPITATSAQQQPTTTTVNGGDIPVNPTHDVHHHHSAPALDPLLQSSTIIATKTKTRTKPRPKTKTRIDQQQNRNQANRSRSSPSPPPLPLPLPLHSPSTSSPTLPPPTTTSSTSSPSHSPNDHHHHYLLSSNHHHPTTTTTLTLSSELVQHSLTPLKVGKGWACRICRREFTRRFNCTTHERTHLDLRERAQFQCALCDRAFTRRHDLERHVHSVHPGHILEREPLLGTVTISGERPHYETHNDPSTTTRNPFSSSSQQLKIRRLDDGELVGAIVTEGSSGLVGGSSNGAATDQVRILVIDPPLPSQDDRRHSEDPYSIHIPSSSSDPAPGPTAILASGSIRDLAQAIERVPLDQLPSINPTQDAIFRYNKKWACGTCGRLFIRRNNCKAHEATHRDVREHQCTTCSRSFSRRHDLERHISAVHPGSTLPTCSESFEPTPPRKRRRRAKDEEEEGFYEYHEERQDDEEPQAEWKLIDPSILGEEPSAPVTTLGTEEPRSIVKPKKKKAKNKKPVISQTTQVFNIFEAFDDKSKSEHEEMAFDPRLLS